MPFDITAPVARILTKSAPFLKLVRTDLPHLVHAIGQIADDRHVHVDRELPRVARAAGCRDVVAGHLQARPGHRALVDGVAEIDVHVRPGRAHVPARRETGQQRRPGVDGAVDGRAPGVVVSSADSQFVPTSSVRCVWRSMSPGSTVASRDRSPDRPSCLRPGRPVRCLSPRMSTPPFAMGGAAAPVDDVCGADQRWCRAAVAGGRAVPLRSP